MCRCSVWCRAAHAACCLGPGFLLCKQPPSVPPPLLQVERPFFEAELQPAMARLGYQCLYYARQRRCGLAVIACFRAAAQAPRSTHVLPCPVRPARAAACPARRPRMPRPRCLRRTASRAVLSPGATLPHLAAWL